MEVIESSGKSVSDVITMIKGDKNGSPCSANTDLDGCKVDPWGVLGVTMIVKYRSGRGKTYLGGVRPILGGVWCGHTQL